jgi:hypothetical protein
MPGEKVCKLSLVPFQILILRRCAFGRASVRARTPKPSKATPKPTTSQPQATPMRPSCDPQAPLKPPPSHLMRPQSHRGGNAEGRLSVRLSQAEDNGLIQQTRRTPCQRPRSVMPARLCHPPHLHPPRRAYLRASFPRKNICKYLLRSELGLLYSRFRLPLSGTDSITCGTDN